MLNDKKRIMKWYWILLIVASLLVVLFKVIIPYVIWMFIHRGHDPPPQARNDQGVGFADGTAVRVSFKPDDYTDTYYWYYGRTRVYHGGRQEYAVRIAHGNQGKNVPSDRVREWRDFTQDEVSSLEYHTGDDAVNFPNHTNTWIKVTSIKKVDTVGPDEMPTYAIVVVDPDNAEESKQLTGIPASSLRMFHESEDDTPVLST
jgi:hypothetical protein